MRKTRLTGYRSFFIANSYKAFLYQSFYHCYKEKRDSSLAARLGLRNKFLSRNLFIFLFNFSPIILGAVLNPFSTKGLCPDEG